MLQIRCDGTKIRYKQVFVGRIRVSTGRGGYRDAAASKNIYVNLIEITENLWPPSYMSLGVHESYEEAI